MSDFLDEIEACIPALRRYARALTPSAEIADDLVQDCIERALRKSRLWQPKGALKSWLFTIMLNIYRNDLRSAKRNIRLVQIDETMPEPSVPPPQGERLALAETAQALEQLPEEQREALLLVVLEGMSYIEAADILNIPKGTLMSRLGRARQTLRRLTGEAGSLPLRTVK